MVALATLTHLAAANEHGATFGGDDAQARDHLHSTDFHANDLEEAPQGQRILQTRTVTTHPLKIFFDYSLVEDPAVIPWVKALFGDYVGGRMSNLLSVTSDGYMPVVNKAGGPSTLSCYTTYPWGQRNPEYLNGSMPYDIIIVVRTYSANTSAIATGQNCYMDPTAKRTILGVMSINMEKWKLVGEDDIEQTANVMTHECMHILGFGRTGVNGFPNTIFSNVNTLLPNGTTVPLVYITSPGVVSWARENFNCPTLQGLLWENEGGDGTMNAHWEALTAGNEVITGVVNGKMVVGPLTANYFQDSGAYTVNFAMVEDNPWGRGQGCGFVNADCKVPNTYREFIPASSSPNACSYDFTSRVRGSVQGTTGNCSIAWFSNNNTCNRGTTFNTHPNRRGSYGATSRCFITNVGPFSSGDAWRPGAECYKSKCINGGIQFTTGDGVVGMCNTTGQVITININAKVTCPNIQEFCGNYTVTMTCPNDCSGNGRCLKNGQCSCFFYWTGTDCSTRKACDYGTTVCGLVGVAGGAQVGFQETGSAGLSWFHSLASMIVVMVSIFSTR